MVPVLFDSATNEGGIFNDKYFCENFIFVCKNSYQRVYYQDYEQIILSDKPEFLESNDFHDKLYDEIASDETERKTYDIVHMTDLHVDYHYEPGMSTACNHFVCCRDVSGPPKKESEKAGYWGANNGICDLPI